MPCFQNGPQDSQTYQTQVIGSPKRSVSVSDHRLGNAMPVVVRVMSLLEIESIHSLLPDLETFL